MSNTKTILKPWGKEVWIELNDHYCYKRIYINAGYRTSYQYHEFKIETNYIISGTAEVWLENDEGVVEKKIMNAGDFFNVTPPKKHRVIAITDIILQEVSTPQVDDVIRIEDDTKRIDGKIEGEHKTPAVLILTAGLGTRLGNLTKEINKALIPIKNRAIISYIIEQFPQNYDFVIAVGYKSESLKEYCELSFPQHNITFVNVDDIDGIKSGPGYSALQCKNLLQRPFYLTTCDTIITSQTPHLDGNWLAVYPTSFPEKYSTLKVNSKSEIIEYKNKSADGFDLAFVGLASIWDYDVFWNELENNIKNGEVVSAFENPQKYPTFKTKKVEWLDTGNIDDLNKTKIALKDKPLSLEKDNGEILYKEQNKLIKFTPNNQILKNRNIRSEYLNGLIPNNFGSNNNFIYYDWEEGKTLYEYDDFNLYVKFLDFLDVNLKTTIPNSYESIRTFYINKTLLRMDDFVKKYGDDFYLSEHEINGIKYPSMKHLLEHFDFDVFDDNPFYSLFHGDLQFDNIIYNTQNSTFTYIDWRDSFSLNTDGGDVYYDLAKLYGGIIIPYNLMKNEDAVTYNGGSYIVNFSYQTPKNLTSFKKSYESWLMDKGYDLNKIKMITGLIYLNMSPLHDEKFSKLLWFKSIEMLYGCVNK